MVLSWVEGDWIPTSKQIGERRGKGEKGGKKKTRKHKKRGEAPPSKDEESDHHEPKDLERQWRGSLLQITTH